MMARRNQPSPETRTEADTPPLLPRKPRKRSRRIFPWRRLLRFVLATAIVVGSLAVIAIAAINFSVRIVLPHYLSSRMDAEVRVNGAGLDFRHPSIIIRGLEIRGSGMEEFSCDRVAVIPDPAIITQHILALGMINLDHPRLRLPSTTPPLSFLLGLAAKNPRLPYIFRNITIHGGTITSRQTPGPEGTAIFRRQGFERIEEIELNLPLFSNTRVKVADSRSREWLAPTFSAVVDSTPVAFKGQSAILADGIEARLNLHLPRLDLEKHLRSLPMLPGTRLIAGTADLDFETIFRIRQGDDDILSLNGGGRITNLILERADSRIDIPAIRFSGNFSPLASSYNFTEIVIDRPTATFNRGIDRLFIRPDLPLIRIGTMLINQGSVSAFDDTPFSLTGIDFSLISYPGHGRNPASFAATGILNRHATLRIKGGVPADGSINADLACQGLDLATIPLDIPGGSSLKRGHARTISATINTGGTKPELRITAAEINDLEIRSRAGSTLFFPSLTMDNSGEATAGGEIDLGNITAPAFLLTVAANERPDGFIPTKRFSLHALDLTGGTIKFLNREDLGDWRPARITVKGHDATASPRITISGESDRGGTVRISGRVKEILSARGELDCGINSLPLTMFTAINAKLFPRLPQAGRLSATGVITLSPPGFKGKAEISDIRIGASGASSFLAVKSLDLADFTLMTSPPSLWIKNGSASGATMRIRESEGKKSGRRPWRVRNDRARVKIDRLRLTESRLAIEDHSPEPPLNLALNINHGEISNIGKMTAIDLEGQTWITAGAPFSGVGGATGIRLTGIKNGDEDEFNLSFAIKDLDLTPLSPYLSRLAAFTLRTGKGDWRGRISLRRGQLVADTRMTIRDLETIAGPDCRFDLELARALLMPPDGGIDIDFPVSANMSRGRFSLYPVIGKKIRSLLLRSSVVPFSLLSDTNGRAPDEFIRFAPLETNLSPEGEKNLNLIAGALERRPALGIELSGNGPLIEIAPETQRQSLTERATIDLGLERALRVMQFLHDRGINDSRLRIKEADAGIGEEILDRPEDRVDLNLFAAGESAGD